ncbi:MAG: ABC transporter permease [Bacteroidales bacterium]|jgi:D-methionine transport system permease protein|nr:ABC transporter permease [Bacteroidales bacterium]MBP5703844.1 ABC transporter permease [Paludibacteraceae bacterium]MBR5210656.1 ABC transporter permease [Paludibacteraceae bacterium]MEE1062801.1 methionine ABC transporter permease [Paludibacteraceae bacterium]MEE1083584.1 methionine ABC transporter permease [Paludibacteraceae bacterium]
MNDTNYSELLNNLLPAFGETLEMCGIALLLAVVLGTPLGVLSYITSKQSICQNRVVNLFVGFIINVIMSTPFVILLVLLLPFTRFVVGTSIGPEAASVPLGIVAIAFYARLVEGNLHAIDKGVIEASLAMGATWFRIVTNVLLPGAFSGMIRGLTVLAVTLVGYSAMAGIVGGGGVGDLAIRFGYYRYQTDIMIITVLLLIGLVQIIQTIGEKASRKVQK